MLRCSPGREKIRTREARNLLKLHRETETSSESHAKLDEMDDEDEDDYDEADNSQKDSRVVTDDDNLCVLSTFLYSLAMHDGKTNIENEILRRRQQISADQEAAKELKAKQAAVSIRADSARLPDIANSLNNRFAAIDSALEELKENAATAASNNHVGEADA